MLTAAVLAGLTVVTLRFVGRAERARLVAARLGDPRRRSGPRWPVLLLASRPTRPARDLAEYMESLARAVRSGSSIRQAVDEIEPPPALARQVDRLRRRLADGLSAPEALAGWRHDDPGSDVALASAGLELAARGGGEMARAFDAVAGSLREHAAVGDEIRSLSTQVRASALLIALLPAAFALLATAADPGTLSFLVRTRLGLACLAGAAVLEALGSWWMRRIMEAIEW